MSAQITRLPTRTDTAPLAPPPESEGRITRLSAYVAADYPAIGYTLDQYLQIHRMDQAGLARWLRMEERHVDRLRYCPVPMLGDWPEILAFITGWAPCDVSRLAQVLRELRELRELARGRRGHA